MYVVNFTRFHLRGEATEPVREAHRAWSSKCANHDQFRGGLLIALEHGEWLDVSIWSQADGASLDQAPPLELVDWIDPPDTEVLGQEAGVLSDELITPLVAPRGAFEH